MQERTRASLARLACVQGAACTVLVVVVLRWIAAQKPVECDATKFAPSADQEDLAAITYRRQARERQREPSRVHDAIGANWPCWWGVEVTGTVEAFRHGWKSGGNQYTDGWKFTCGLRLLADPCVIYTLGGSRNLAFEAAALETRSFCELHVFDHKDESAEAAQWFAPGQRRRVMFHRVAIAAAEDLTASPPRRTLRPPTATARPSHLDGGPPDTAAPEGPGRQSSPVPWRPPPAPWRPPPPARTASRAPPRPPGRANPNRTNDRVIL